MDQKHALRQRRHYRLRRKLSGTAERPRLAVVRSLNHIFAQGVGDTPAPNFAAAPALHATLEGDGKSGGNVAAAEAVGTLIGERAKQSGIARVVFDRGGFKYHGRVRSLADAARKAGLEF